MKNPTTQEEMSEREEHIWRLECDIARLNEEIADITRLISKLKEYSDAEYEAAN